MAQPVRKPQETVPEFWLMGVVSGCPDPELLETGTKEEVELVRDLYLSGSHPDTGLYEEFFVLGVCSASVSDIAGGDLGGNDE